MDRFEFRDVHPSEVERVIEIEHTCFPPNEACSAKAMTERIGVASELFLVAIDKTCSKIAGFLNGVSTDESRFRDEFFTDISLHKPDGTHVMLIGLDVLPEYRKQGLAREIINRYCQRELKKGRKMLHLTCHEDKVKMYEKLDFVDKGIANSTWGGGIWHEMYRKL